MHDRLQSFKTLKDVNEKLMKGVIPGISDGDNDDLTSLLLNMFKRDASERYSIKQVLDHQWFKE